MTDTDTLQAPAKSNDDSATDDERFTAFFSVHDDYKPAALEMARELHELGNWDLVSSGRTADFFRDAGLPVTSVSEITDYPEILDHRVVTLHPKIHGAILAERGNLQHDADRKKYGIGLFDLVVVALYPFDRKPSVDMIDIGGSALTRGAAKNFEFVGVVVDVEDYRPVLAEIRASGWLSFETRLRLARKAYGVSRDYDKAVESWLDSFEWWMQDHPLDKGPDSLRQYTAHIRERIDKKKSRQEAPMCLSCGVYMLPAGSVWACPSCGNTHERSS